VQLLDLRQGRLCAFDRAKIEVPADPGRRQPHNTGVAQHTFCKVCGIKPFYTPRSNPDGIDVNVRCLDTAPDFVAIEPFDGHNWEQNAGKLAGLSKAD
jgi:hypothetical protein